jgi:8-oxo-dGTP pyrophosphatase MutT (NUDIX family)
MKDNKCTAAGFIIYRVRNDEPQILGLIARPYFQKESKGVYDIPKGQKEENEDPYSCALRECFEESSLTPDNIVGGPFKHGSLWLWLAHCDDTPVINVNPVVGVKEHLGYKWLTPNEIISECLDYLRKPLLWASEQLWKLHL